jgi:O-antigen ligase
MPRPNQVSKDVRRIFVLFVFSIPLEAADLGFLSGNPSLARITGLLFFAACLIYARRSFAKPPLELLAFATYLLIFFLNGLSRVGVPLNALLSPLLTLAQLMAFFWAASTVMREERISRLAVLAFCSSCTFLGTAGMLGLPGFSQIMRGQAGVDRLSFLGYNPNDLGLMAALSALIAMGLLINGSVRSAVGRIALMLSLMPLGMVIIRTGSRGSALAFLVGLAVYYIPFMRSRGTAMRILLAAVAFVGLTYLVSTNLDVLERYRRAVETGDTSGRDKIWMQAVGMIAERPVFGWGAIGFYYELGYRESGQWRARDAHNLLLHLLLEDGFLGAAPFLIGLWLCVRSAWRARSKLLGLTPLALILCFLVGSMAGTYIERKYAWIVLALCVAVSRPPHWIPSRIGPRQSPRRFAQRNPRRFNPSPGPVR